MWSQQRLPCHPQPLGTSLATRMEQASQERTVLEKARLGKGGESRQEKDRLAGVLIPIATLPSLKTTRRVGKRRNRRRRVEVGHQGGRTKKTEECRDTGKTLSLPPRHQHPHLNPSKIVCEGNADSISIPFLVAHIHSQRSGRLCLRLSILPPCPIAQARGNFGFLVTPHIKKQRLHGYCGDGGRFCINQTGGEQKADQTVLGGPFRGSVPRARAKTLLNKRFARQLIRAS